MLQTWICTCFRMKNGSQNNKLLTLSSGCVFFLFVFDRSLFLKTHAHFMKNRCFRKQCGRRRGWNVSASTVCVCNKFKLANLLFQRDETSVAMKVIKQSFLSQNTLYLNQNILLWEMLVFSSSFCGHFFPLFCLRRIVLFFPTGSRAITRIVTAPKCESNGTELKEYETWTTVKYHMLN